jgi:hypothetical protein
MSHSPRLCYASLASFRHRLGRNPHRRLSGMARRSIRVVAAQYGAILRSDQWDGAAQERGAPHQYWPRRSGAGRRRCLPGAARRGLPESAQPGMGHRHISWAGRAGQLSHQCHRRGHKFVDRGQDSMGRVLAQLVDLVDRGHQGYDASSDSARLQVLKEVKRSRLTANKPPKRWPSWACLADFRASFAGFSSGERGQGT